MPRPRSSSTRRSPNYRAPRARKALVALAVGWFLLVTSMTALVIGTVLSLAARIGPLLAGLAVGVPLAARRLCSRPLRLGRASRAWRATRRSARRSRAGQRRHEPRRDRAGEARRRPRPRAGSSDPRRGPAAAAPRQPRRGGLGRGQGQERRPRRRRAAGGEEAAGRGLAGARRLRLVPGARAAETGGRPAICRGDEATDEGERSNGRRGVERRRKE